MDRQPAPLYLGLYIARGRVEMLGSVDGWIEIGDMLDLF